MWRVILVKQNILLNEDDISPEELAKIKTPLQVFTEKMREKLKSSMLKRASVKEFNYKNMNYEERKRQKFEVTQNAQKTSVELKETCEKCFSDLYVSYIHLKVLRFNVDRVMRFGQTHPLMTAMLTVWLSKKGECRKG